MALTTLDTTTALVVIDLQKGLRNTPTVPSVDDIITRAASLAAAFRRHGLPVVLVNVAGGAPGRTDTASRSHFTPSAEWIELVDELHAQPTDHLITKMRRSAFQDTSLDADLRTLGVTQIVVAGMSTTSGVESTARSAYDHGYHVVLAVDAMTDPDPADHAHSVHRVFPRLGETATTAQILALLDTNR